MGLLFLGWQLPTTIVAADAPVTSGFFLGADISALDAPGRGGKGTNRVYQDNGKTNDEMTILLNHGWTAFRLRVFVSPVRKAPNNTVEAAIPLAKRIKAAGATFLLDPHFSDTWADPGHQETPRAWTNLDFEGLEKEWEVYASNVTKQFKDAGAMPDWVQIGNEITAGADWPLAQLWPSPRQSARPVATLRRGQAMGSLDAPAQGRHSWRAGRRWRRTSSHCNSH